MNPVIALIKRATQGKDWQRLYSHKQKHAHKIAEHVDTGVRSLSNRCRLSFNPIDNTYWIAFEDDKFTTYSPIPYSMARSILLELNNFKYVHSGWQADTWLDERNVTNQDFIQSLSDTEIHANQGKLSLKLDEASDSYFLKQLTRRGLGIWYEYHPTTDKAAEALLSGNEQLTKKQRHWATRGWLDDTDSANKPAIAALIPSGIDNRLNGISLLSQPDSTVHWLKHTMLREDTQWHSYQPISFQQAQEIKDDHNRFSEYVQHIWLVEGRLNEYIAPHVSEIAMLKETSIPHPTEQQSLLQHTDTNDYWVKRLKRRGDKIWFEYQRIDHELANRLSHSS